MKTTTANKMTDEEWQERVAQIRDGSAKYDQLKKDAKKFLEDNATILNDYWEEGIICKHCGKSYFLDMYHSGQLQRGKMYRNFLNHMLKVHQYKDESFCQLMKFHIREASYRTKGNHLEYTVGDH